MAETIELDSKILRRTSHHELAGIVQIYKRGRDIMLTVSHFLHPPQWAHFGKTKT